MDPYLAPVEKPRGLVLKLVYFFTKRQFGKVATPIAVFSSRLPIAFLSFYGKISKLDKKLELPSPTAMLVRERVASLNTCRFCMDVGRWYATKATPTNGPRFDALADYRTSPLFTDAGRRPRDVRPAGSPLPRARDLRDRLARRQRASLQREQHRPQHRFGRPLRAGIVTVTAVRRRSLLH